MRNASGSGFGFGFGFEMIDDWKSSSSRFESKQASSVCLDRAVGEPEFFFIFGTGTVEKGGLVDWLFIYHIELSLSLMESCPW